MSKVWNDQQEEDAFQRTGLDVPLDHELQQMSFVELAALLSSCKSGSAKFSIVERELKKHLAKDQAKINRPNMLYAACVGGVFALAGVVLGHYLRNDVPPSGAVQKVEKSDLGIKPSITEVPQVVTPLLTQSPPHPTDVQKNAQPSQAKP